MNSHARYGVWALALAMVAALALTFTLTQNTRAETTQEQCSVVLDGGNDGLRNRNKLAYPRPAPSSGHLWIDGAYVKDVAVALMQAATEGGYDANAPHDTGEAVRAALAAQLTGYAEVELRTDGRLRIHGYTGRLTFGGTAERYGFTSPCPDPSPTTSPTDNGDGEAADEERTYTQSELDAAVRAEANRVATELGSYVLGNGDYTYDFVRDSLAAGVTSGEGEALLRAQRDANARDASASVQTILRLEQCVKDKAALSPFFQRDSAAFAAQFLTCVGQ